MTKCNSRNLGSSLGTNNCSTANVNEQTYNATNPIKSINDSKKELVSSEYSNAVAANSKFQIDENGVLKYDTTPEKYISKLIKAGKIPNRNFVVEELASPNGSEDGGLLYITELNNNGKKIKNTIFYRKPDSKDYDLSYISFTNPTTDKPYKWITYPPEKNGTYTIDRINPNTGEIIKREWYNADGTIKKIDTLQDDKN